MKQLLVLLFSVLHLWAYDAFISVETLKKSLDDEKLIIIDVSDSYKKSHIKGAISLDVYDLIDKEKKNNTLKSLDDLEEIFVDLGLSSDSNVVIYARTSDEDIKKASYLAFVLISHGFENVSILDGGYMSWVYEYDELVSNEDFEAEEEGDITLDPLEMQVWMDEVGEDLSKYIVLNSSSEDYTELLEIFPKAKVSFYKNKFLRDFTILTKNKLNKIYFDIYNLNKNDKILVYGSDIFEVSVEWFIVYKYMGFKSAKIYL